MPCKLCPPSVQGNVTLKNQYMNVLSGLKADDNDEGCIFDLYSLLCRHTSICLLRYIICLRNTLIFWELKPNTCMYTYLEALFSSVVV